MLPKAERIVISGSEAEVTRHFEEQGWTDGLPIVAPTEERISAMLGAVPGDSTVSIGAVPPLFGEATLEKLAANAVMAGCRPEYFPVVITAVRAMLRPQFNLDGIQVTTHPAAPLAIVHGPIAREIGVNGATGAFGPGYPANATIGRALRLILVSIGGAHPRSGDRSTQASPAKYSYCVGENVNESPWPEFHTTRGFSETQSAVTVFAGEAPRNVHDHESTASELLDLVADVMASLGHNNWFICSRDGITDMIVAFSAEHAKTLATEGFSRDDVQRYLYHRARRTVRELVHGGMWDMRDWPTWLRALAKRDDEKLPPVRRPEDILVLVVGGTGRHSCVIPGFGASQSVTEEVRSQLTSE